MNITKNSDCTAIHIANDLFEDFKDSLNEVTEVVIKYVVNGATEVIYEAVPEDVSEGAISLDMAFFNQDTETLCDGIYCFTVEITQGSTVIKSYGNILVDCSLLCSLAVAVFNNPTKLLHAKYEAIKYYQQCNSCDCTTVYKLYKDLLQDLDLNNQNTSDCGCGC